MGALRGHRASIIGSGRYNITSSKTASPPWRPRGIGRYFRKVLPVLPPIASFTKPRWASQENSDWRKWDLWLNDERSGNWNMENLPWK